MPAFWKLNRHSYAVECMNATCKGSSDLTYNAVRFVTFRFFRFSEAFVCQCFTGLFYSFLFTFSRVTPDLEMRSIRFFRWSYRHQGIRVWVFHRAFLLFLFHLLEGDAWLGNAFDSWCSGFFGGRSSIEAFVCQCSTGLFYSFLSTFSRATPQRNARRATRAHGC